MDTPPLKLAIIGCGAVTELYHLPASQETDQVEVTVLVDCNLPRAQHLAKQYNIEYATDNYQTIRGKADAAIVALPHDLHAVVTIELLQKGIHVLVEKPIALRLEECDQMIAAAEQSRSVLAVGLVRRFYPVSKLIKDYIRNGFLGDILSFDVREGGIYEWPVASDFFFRKEKAGGGVLIDTGAHTLDMTLWWLGDFDSVKYFDDAFGGVEANCELHLLLKNGAKGIVELSRTRQLRNTYQINGTKMNIEISAGAYTSFNFRLTDHNMTWHSDLVLNSSEPYTFHQVMCAQLRNFAEAVLHRTAPLVSGIEGRNSLALIQTCYSQANKMVLPWLQNTDAIKNSNMEEFS